MKLYEISNDYIDLINQADSDESIRDALDDTLHIIGSEFDNKAIDIAKYILNLEAEYEAVKKAENGMKDRRLTLEKKVSWLKSYTKKHMQKLEKSKISCPEFEIKIKKNPSKVIIDNEDLIPEIFKKRVITITIDKSSLSLKLKEESISGCHLEQSQRLEIK